MSDEREMPESLRGNWDDGDADGLAGAGPDLDAMFVELESQIEARSALSRLADLPSAARFALVAATAALLVIASDKVQWAAAGPLMIAACVGYLTGLTWLLMVALRPVHRPSLSDPAQWTGIGVITLSVVAIAALPGSDVGHAAGAVGASPVKCLGFGTLVSLPVFFLLRLLDRGQRFGPWLAALGAGVLGNLALQVRCPSGEPTHRLMGHAAVVLLTVGLAFLIALGLGKRRQP